LTDVFAREVNDPAAQIGLADLEVREVTTGFGLGKLIERLGEKRRKRIRRRNGRRSMGSKQAASGEPASGKKAERAERHEKIK
jgi:hypothetical protein